MKTIKIKDSRTGEILEYPATATLSEIMGSAKMNLDEAAEHLSQQIKGLSAARAKVILDMIADADTPYFEAIEAARRGEATDLVLSIEPATAIQASIDVSGMDPIKIVAEMDAQDEIEEPEDLHDESAPDGTYSETLPSPYYTEGHSARMLGRDSQESPYGIDTPEREEWYLGWKAADDDPEAPEITANDAPEEPHEGEAETDEAEPDIAALDAGQAARLADEGPDANPYDGGTDEHTDWVKGYETADADVQDVIESGRQAKRDGQKKSDCPWKKGSDAERFWLQGFNETVDEGGG